VRQTFVRTLVDLAEDDPRIVLLTGDLGFSVIEPFVERFPDRFYNVGVAEQNMVGVATGLAEAGFVPFVYSIATFASLRPYEFIRNGPVLHQLPVRIVGIGGGFEYGHAGPTHYAVEDVGIMRMQSGLTVVCPADHRQAEAAVRATWDLPGPVFYRLGKDERTTVAGLDGRFALDRVQWVREGPDVAFLVTGSMASEVVRAAERLAEGGVDATVGIVATLNPGPADDLADALHRFPVALSVEAHRDVGGLGSLVSEVVAERGIACRVVRCGIRGPLGVEEGGERFLLARHGLTAEDLADAATKALAER
jgi:transketolase